MAIKLGKIDVLILGMGPVGGVGVLPLVTAGLQVKAVEAGNCLLISDSCRNESDPGALYEHQIESLLARARSGLSYGVSGLEINQRVNVDCTSPQYWTPSWRLNPWDFKVVSETAERYGRHRVPTDSTVEDWPLTYKELEPYYDRVEYALGASGAAGNIKDNVQSNGNPYEGPRARGYPAPKQPSSTFTEMMAQAAKCLGWKPFQPPVAFNAEIYGRRPGSLDHSYYQKGLPTDSRLSNPVKTIPEALKAGLLVVETDAIVLSIETDSRGKTTGATYLKDNRIYFQPAEVVLLANSVYENIRLLLTSHSRFFPNGVANNNGQVGRHCVCPSVNGEVLALFPYNLNNWDGTQSQGVAIDDWADDNFDHNNFDFIGGGSLWVHTERNPISAAKMATFGRAPRWGSEWKAFLIENADRLCTSCIYTTTLPYFENRVDVDPAMKDRFGMPVARVSTIHKDENQRRIAAFLQERMREWYREAGASEVFKSESSSTMGTSTHAYGGTRMGNNPKTNVVDAFGFAHEVPNLGILGASVMGTSGARNPTLTAQALAWRTAEHLVENWESRTA